MRLRLFSDCSIWLNWGSLIGRRLSVILNTSIYRLDTSTFVDLQSTSFCTYFPTKSITHAHRESLSQESLSNSYPTGIATTLSSFPLAGPHSCSITYTTGWIPWPTQYSSRTLPSPSAPLSDSLLIMVTLKTNQQNTLTYQNHKSKKNKYTLMRHGS